jgi:xanthine dehydrogenase YagS FAD-binding subunit
LKPFRYLAATGGTADFAVLADPTTHVLAGGTGLVDLMKLGVQTPETVLDLAVLAPIGRPPRDAGGDFARIADGEDGDLFVGALVRNSTLAYDDRVRTRYPVLAEALLSGASAQLRNLATVGGNLMQRTRCAYFRATDLPCNKRVVGSGCGAMAGVHRGHAILGTSGSCIATHPSDMCVALAILEPTLVIATATEPRTIPFDELHLLPGDTPHRETTLAPGELILGMVLPAPLPRAKQRYLKVRDRASYEFALASAAVQLVIHDKMVIDARIALGGVATIPWRASAAEEQLEGKPATRASFQAAAELALAHAHPLRDNAFKVDLAINTIVRALELAAEAP